MLILIIEITEIPSRLFYELPFYNMGGLQPISRDTDNNGEMYKCWWTNKGS